MTSAYPDIEGQLYTTGAPDATYTEAEARQRAADRREVKGLVGTEVAAAVAPFQSQVSALSSRVDKSLTDAKAYTDAQLAGLDLGSGIETVLGTVTLDATGEPIREFYTTGTTTFSANGTTVQIAAHTALVWRRTGVGSWGYQEVPDEWTTPTPTPDTTDPVAGTLAVAVTDVKADLTVSGASDDRGVVSYAFSKDNGSTWSGYQGAASYTFTGLSPSTAYQFRHRVKDAAGNVTTGTAVTRTTAATPPPALPAKDTFTGASDGSVVGRRTEVGNFPWETGTANDYVASGSMMGPPTVTGEKATKGSFILTIPTEKASIEFDYNVPGDIVRIAVASDGSTPLMVQINAQLGIFRMYNGGTELSPSSGEAVFKNAGHALVAYDGANLTLSIDGVQVMSREATGKTGKRFGFNIPANTTAATTVDNVEVKAL